MTGSIHEITEWNIDFIMMKEGCQICRRIAWKGVLMTKYTHVYKVLEEGSFRNPVKLLLPVLTKYEKGFICLLCKFLTSKAEWYEASVVTVLPFRISRHFSDLMGRIVTRMDERRPQDVVFVSTWSLGRAVVRLQSAACSSGALITYCLLWLRRQEKTWETFCGLQEEQKSIGKRCHRA
jgi:hypothetical protein